MNYAAFNASCPFEIGDVVLDVKSKSMKTITDIACIHYLKPGRVEFRYEFNNSGVYFEITYPKVGVIK